MREPGGTLYLVPTPLGNLEDVTFRAVRVLREAALILAEDTRTTRRLLSHHGIEARLLSYTEHNHRARLPQILRVLEQNDVALVSEAGMPGINDPGQPLAAAVWDAGGRVVGLPGASAVPLAVAVSGFPWRAFSFLGFLPHAAGERRALLRAQGASGNLLVAFETPHRLRTALEDIATLFGERPIAVCRELTKLHEEIFRGTAAGALAHFAEPRGEITLVIAAPERAAHDEAADEPALHAFLAERLAAGSSARDAVAAAMARFGLARRAAYAAWEQAKHDAGPES